MLSHYAPPSSSTLLGHAYNSGGTLALGHAYNSGGTLPADKRRPRGRSKSPKKVRYNTRVRVRHSDTEDSMFTQLSPEGGPDDDVSAAHPLSRSVLSPRYNEFSQLSPISLPSPQHQTSTLRSTPRFRDYHKAPPTGSTGSRTGPPPYQQAPAKPGSWSSPCTTDRSDTSGDSGLDYSSELKDLSQQITDMDWSPRQKRPLRARPPPGPSPTHHQPHGRQQQQQQQQQQRGQQPVGGQRVSPTPSSSSPPGILKDSQNSRGSSRDARGAGSISYGNGAVTEGNGGVRISGSRTSPAHSTRTSPAHSTRTSPAHCADGKENDPSASPSKTTPIAGRVSPVEAGRLTPSKRSVSLSITNFLKRFSPHARRKPSKERGASKSSSAAGSAQSLTNTSDGDTDRDSPTSTGENSTTGGGAHPDNSAGGSSKSRKGKGHFSRSRVRQSLLKLVGRSGKKATSGSAEALPVPSHYTIELQDPDRTLSSDELDQISDTGRVVNYGREPGSVANGRPSLPASTTRMIKSIQQDQTRDQDIYRKFKERQSPRHAPADQSQSLRPSTTDHSQSPPGSNQQVSPGDLSAAKIDQPVRPASCVLTFGVDLGTSGLLEYQTVRVSDC
ncbi:putative uncharacterized protein DDB_G0277255 [Aplysia californica]|uniref:Uncharacterized protein n=1 Tax=Aplysia californica TaxID=6500 RepID=A0ABM1AE42_APLCA|nr:putative uncharacterized protein DDB_G0277255 [Aplysia californica]